MAHTRLNIDQLTITSFDTTASLSGGKLMGKVGASADTRCTVQPTETENTTWSDFTGPYEPSTQVDETIDPDLCL